MIRKRILLIVTLLIIILAPVLFFIVSTSHSSEPQTILVHPGTASKTYIHNTDKEFTLRLILLKENIYGYNGNAIEKGSLTKYASVDGLIKSQLTQWKDSFRIIIKPTSDASYISTVDVLDKMTLNNIKHYAVEDLTSAEKNYIQQIQE